MSTSRPWHIILLEALTIWLFNIAMENHHFLIGKPSINGPFSMAMLVITRGYLPPTRRDQSSSHRHGFGKTGDMSHVIPGIQESGTRSAFTRSPGLEKPLNRSIGGFSSNDWITIPCDEDQPLVAKLPVLELPSDL